MNDTSAGLFALVYASDAVGSTDDTALNALLEQARVRNKSLGITGILLYRDGRFVQYLEGAEADVRAVYADIAADTRHTNLRILLEGPVAARRFSSWTMGYEPLRAAPGALPVGMRNTFADLVDGVEPAHVLRALSELALWFRVRTTSA